MGAKKWSPNASSPSNVIGLTVQSAVVAETRFHIVPVIDYCPNKSKQSNIRVCTSRLLYLLNGAMHPSAGGKFRDYTERISFSH